MLYTSYAFMRINYDNCYFLLLLLFCKEIYINSKYIQAYQQKNQELVIFHLQQVRSIPRSCLPVKVN